MCVYFDLCSLLGIIVVCKYDILVLYLVWYSCSMMIFVGRSRQIQTDSFRIGRLLYYVVGVPICSSVSLINGG